MAMDLAPFDIRVNCVCPGVTDTPALAVAIEELGMSAEEARQAVMVPRALIKRFGRPEEIANAILFVASKEASYVTGATLVVDGGYTT
jgi:NAD(P)-dependent dehydrogenase (short-subunit alcohol dehydrogenase family)